MRKYILYTIGIAIMALGVAISSFHGLGASPFDSLNFNVASITNLEIATTMLIFNAIFVLLFFIIHRNKDIYLSIICLFAFSFLVDTFIKLLSYIFIIDDLWFRIIQFILGFTLTAIGIAFVEESTLSRTPFECFIAVMDKIVFPKLDYAKSRIITEVLVTALGAVLGLIFMDGLGNVGIGTAIYMFCTGPVVQLFIKKFSRIIKEDRLK
jgi:uncharacterized membrane protein YczE